jgi:hypothetical protein
VRVEQAERPHHQVERDHGGDGRQHALREKPDGDVAVLPALKAEAGDGIGGRRPEDDRKQRSGDRDDRAVGQSLCRFRRAELIDPVVQRRREVDPGNAEPGDGERIERVAQRLRERPVDREEEDQRDADRGERGESVAESRAFARAAVSHRTLATA